MAKWNEPIELPGDPTRPDEAANKNYVDSQLAKKAPLQSPALTGTPTAPTAPTNTNSTQLATTAFVRAQIAADAPTRTGGGASGMWGINISGEALSAQWLSQERIIALTGGATGEVKFDGSRSVSMTVTISDNSHRHTIANITGLQTALDNLARDITDHHHDGRYVSMTETNLGKVGSHGNVKTLNTSEDWSSLPVGYSAFIASSSGGMGTQSGAPNDGFGYFTKIANRDTAGGWAGLWADHAGTNVYIGRTSTAEEFATWTRLWNSNNFNPDSKLDKAAAAVSAAKLTTARTLTFSGDVTGSVLFDGSANVTIDLQVADNSHQHAIANITGLQAALDDKPSNTGSGASGTWSIDVTGTSRALASIHNQRAVKPVELTHGRMHSYFVSLTGLNNTTGSTDYHDLLVLDSCTDSSGKKINALAFDKSTQLIHHFQAAQDAQLWGTPKTLAYTDSDITGGAARLTTARKINGVSFDGTQDITVPVNIADGALTIAKVAGLQTALEDAVQAGEFGLGGMAVVTEDFDAITSTGFYRNSMINAVGAPSTVSGLAVLHIETSTAHAVQIALRSASDQIWSRRRYNGTWNAWVEHYHTGNFNPSDKLDTTATAAAATRLATTRKIGLSGDLTGSATFDGSADITISAQVAHNSHIHTIANITGLQTALNNKADSTSPLFTGVGRFDAPGTSPAGSFIEINSPGGHPGLVANHSGTHRSDIQFRNGYVFIGASGNATVPTLGVRVYDDGHLNVSGDITAANGNSVWHAGNFNPDDKLTRTATAVAANKLAVARTISLTGNVTGSTTFDGSGNVSISATVAANSHVHTIANVTGLQAALDARVTKEANTLASLKDTSIGPGLANGQVLRYQNGTWFNSNITFGDVGGLSDALDAKLDKTAAAVSATKLATPRTINGVAFDGTQNISIEAAFPSTVNPDSFDSLTANGIYFSNVGTIGRPTASNYVTMLHMSRAPNRHAQFAIDTYDSSRAFIRSYGISEAWDSWNELWTSANFDPNSKMDKSWRITAGDGLLGGGDGSAARTVSLGTPGTLSGSTTNNVTTSSHTHALSANLSAWDAITPESKVSSNSPTFNSGYFSMYPYSSSHVGTENGRLESYVSETNANSPSWYMYYKNSTNAVRALNLIVNGEFYSKDNKVWHAGNFDPSSKLDRTGGVVEGNGGSYEWAPLHIRSTFSSGAAAIQFTNGTNTRYFGMGGDGTLRTSTSTTFSSGEEVWTSASFDPATKMDKSGGTITGNVTISKNNPWLTLMSSSSGTEGYQQAAGISIGESGYKGSAALHLTYTGTGDGYIGMGAVDNTTSIPAHVALKFRYTNSSVEMPGHVTVGGNLTANGLSVGSNSVWHAGNLNPADFGSSAPATITAETGNTTSSSTHTHALTMSYGNDSLTGDELPSSYPNNSVTVTRRGSASGTSWPEHGTVLTANTYSNRAGQLLFAGTGNNLYFRGGGSSWGLWHTVYHTGNLDASSLVTTARSISAGNGLSGGGNFTTNRTISLGTPGTLSGSTTNNVSTSSHTHALSANLSAWDGYSPSDSTVFKGNIGGSENLNNYTETGWYHQPANANAGSGTNYPVSKAGLLEVYASGGMVYQRYTEYNGGVVWTRSKYSSTWYSWKQVWDSSTDITGISSSTTFTVTTPNGNVAIGPSNSSYCHFNTDRTQFYFNKDLRINGTIYAGSGYNQRVWTESDHASYAQLTSRTYLHCGQSGTTDSSRIYSGSSGNMFLVSGNTAGHIYFRPRGWSSTNQAYLNNNGTMYAGDFQLSSDESLKKDIDEIQFNGRLRPVEFTWRGSGKRDFGFIAQDVQALYPMAVDKDIPSPTEDEGEIEPKLTLSYSKLTAILSAQLNAAEDRVDVLEEELRSVKDSALKMQDQIDELKELVRQMLSV